MAIAGVPMMLHLYLLLGQQAANVNEVLDRFASAHKQPVAVEATMTATLNGGSPLSTKVRFDKGASTWFRAESRGEHYILSISPVGIVELDSYTKLYDEHPYPGNIQLFSSRVSPALSAYPDWLLITDLRKIGNQQLKWTLVGSAIVNGFPADKIHIKDAGGTYEMHAAIDKTGNIVSFDRTVTTPMGQSRKRWEVTKWQSKTRFAASELQAPIPLGYTPFALDYTYGGLKVGEKFPRSGWQDSSGKSRELGGSKPWLVAMLGEDSEPSMRAAEWLPRLKGRISVSVVSDGTGKSRYREALVDRSGKNVQAIDAQGTPYFALVDGEGKIMKLWMGFDPKTASQFEQDVLASVSGD